MLKIRGKQYFALTVCNDCIVRHEHTVASLKLTQNLLDLARVPYIILIAKENIITATMRDCVVEIYIYAFARTSNQLDSAVFKTVDNRYRIIGRTVVADNKLVVVF